MTPYQAYEHFLVHGRNSELEKIISTSSEYACLYALDAIKGRWIEAENIISTNPYFAYYYARNVIKGRWIEAEDIISTDSKCSYLYAKEVIKGKLPENMHNMMLLHADDWAKEYLDFINNLTPSV